LFPVDLEAVAPAPALLLFKKVIIVIAMPTAKKGTNTIAITPATVPIILPNTFSIMLL
jgi:hypothetical protein